MNREDYGDLAERIEEEMLVDPESVQEQTWNMAIKHAARVVRRAGLGAPWRPASVPESAGA